MTTLDLTPITFDIACQFISAWHRHHTPPAGHKFSIGLDREIDDRGWTLVGVISVGRPSARHYDDGRTLEVTRCCVAPEIHNGCSMLYGAAWRASKALGYRRLITYTRSDEGGASLRGAGWRVVAERRPRKGWNTPSRPRFDASTEHSIQRTLWEAP